MQRTRLRNIYLKQRTEEATKVAYNQQKINVLAFQRNQKDLILKVSM